jgi:hypothetical protein
MADDREYEPCEVIRFEPRKPRLRVICKPEPDEGTTILGRALDRDPLPPAA